jgi:hypothetical protein
MTDPLKIMPKIVISFLRDHIFPQRGFKSASHFSVLFVTLGVEREWWLDIDCGQTGTMINETPELRPRHHKLQWSPYNVITSSRRVICHTRAGQQMGPADCDGGPTHTTTLSVSLHWKKPHLLHVSTSALENEHRFTCNINVEHIRILSWTFTTLSSIYVPRPNILLYRCAPRDRSLYFSALAKREKKIPILD